MNVLSLINSTHFTHSRQVAKISALLAGYSGYSTSEIELIEQAALLHDIGKCDIPADILNKPGALTQQEFEIVKTHTDFGHDKIIQVIDTLSIAAIVAKQHHEWIRDSERGYIGLIGDEIHPYAKIVAIADVYDALASKRSYKDAWGQNEVCQYMQSQAGIHFDEQLISLLLKHINEIILLYNDERKGYVI